MNPKDSLPAGIDVTKPSHALGIIHYQVLDELVIYRPGSSQAASLNESARAVWQLCNGERSLDEICVELAKMYGLTSDQLREDVCNGVLRLRELGLLCQ